jgi:putative hemolysin
VVPSFVKIGLYEVPGAAPFDPGLQHPDSYWYDETNKRTGKHEASPDRDADGGDSLPMLTASVVLVILILVNAFFAASEIALISLNDSKIRIQAEEGDKKALLLQKLLSEPSRFLATIQIGITLAGFLASAFAADSFAEPLAGALADAGVPIERGLLETIAMVLITLLLSYFTLVFGELVPKRLAMKKPEPISRFVVRPLNWLAFVTTPFVRLLTRSTNITVRLFGVNPHEEDDEVTEEEIRMMVDVGKERGTIQEVEKRLIDNIFDFDNKTVAEAMTHRTYVVGIPANSSLQEIVRTIKREKFTRYPVYEGTIDNIIGILHAKDLIVSMDPEQAETIDIKSLIRKPHLIPASRKTDQAYRDLQLSKAHMAVVIDEYGGTAGIITLEDLLEEIVGNIFDEHDEEDKGYVKLDESTFVMRGLMELDDVGELLQVDLPTGEYGTLSGFLIGQLGRIPEPDEHPEIEYEGVLFKVEESNAKRITKVKVYRVP